MGNDFFYAKTFLNLKNILYVYVLCIYQNLNSIIQNIWMAFIISQIFISQLREKSYLIIFFFYWWHVIMWYIQYLVHINFENNNIIVENIILNFYLKNRIREKNIVIKVEILKCPRYFIPLYKHRSLFLIVQSYKHMPNVPDYKNINCSPWGTRESWIYYGS